MTAGIGHVWLAGLLIAMFAYVALPVVVELWPLAAGRVARRPRRTATGRSRHHLDRPMAWPEAAAWTAAMVLVAAVASGQITLLAVA